MQIIQDIDHFIGRNEELKVFTEWLADPRAPHILYFYDALEEPTKKGGIGKTWLLRKCQEIARQQRPDIAIASIDFFTVGNRNGVVVAERIVEALQAAFPDWVPTLFLEAMAEYRDVNRPESIEDAEVRSALFKALTTDLRYLDRQLAEKHKTLLVFYDTYELIEQNPSTAALRFSQKFPDNYLFEHMYAVVAGRNALDWTTPNWKGREGDVLPIALAPFSQTEMVQYIDMESLSEIDPYSQQTQALYERTEGRPILVGLVADVLNKHVTTLENLATTPLQTFEPHLVTQINNLEHPLNWIVLFMAHAYHRFNFEILNWLLQEANLTRLVEDIQYEKMMQELPTLSFIRRPGYGEDFVLHDEMRRLVNQYCWPIHDKKLRYRKAISRSVIKYYKEVMGKELNQQKQQTYQIEILYHKLFLDIQDGLEYFLEHFDQAIDLWQSPFARTLLQETLQFQQQMNPDQYYRLQLAQARLLRAEENPGEALSIYENLERQADERWVDGHRLDLLGGKGLCYLELSRFIEAIDSFTQCLEIEQTNNDDLEIARRQSQLGYTYRRRGQFETAVEFYNQSIVTYKRLNNLRAYADAFNSIGNVYRLQGKTDEALRRCKIALRIRNDLFEAGQISEIPVGLTLSTIGQVYLDIDDLLQAEQVFQKAYEIYNRAKHKKAIASTKNRFGQIAMAKNELQEAKRWFEDAQEASVGIDAEVYVNSLNKQGRVLAKQKRWSEAAAFFGQAVEIARQVHDDFQRTESLIDLAEALTYMKQYEQAQSSLREAERTSQNRNYFDLLGHASEFQGDVDYDSGRYEEAFLHYRDYCYNMARRNDLEYGRALRKLTDRLVQVPKAQLHAIIPMLILYWNEQGMEKKHPDFLSTCQEIEDSL
jgi:tetratricopeptide (TPR) repeat protein